MTTAQTTAQLQAADQMHVWHPFTPMALWQAMPPLVISAAEGMHLVDSDGNRYLDGVSSLWCNVHGHQVREIDQAIREQLGKVSHSTLLGLASEASIILAAKLIQRVPANLKKVFFSDSGASATEIAFKLAAQYWFNLGRPSRNEFVSIGGAYHGDTVGAMSVGRVEAFHRPYAQMMFPTHSAPGPNTFRPPLPPGMGASADEVRDHCLAELERILKQREGKVAAVAMEPLVQGAAGIIVHPPGFLRGVRQLSKKYGALLIADEVAVGFGKTGTLFACEQEQVEPDLLCAGKGITGGYLPLAATFATQEIFDAFLGEPAEGKTFFHGHTYTGNALACAAAAASLDLIDKNDVLANVRRNGNAMAALLAPLRGMDFVGDIRQKGFMVGIELVQDKEARRPFDAAQRVGAEVCTRIRKRGVILRNLGDVVVVMPPLAMGMQDIRTIVDAVREEIALLRA